MPVPEGVTADVVTTHHHMRLFWDELFLRHRDGEPILRAFMSTYGAQMQRRVVRLDHLTRSQLVEELNRTKPSSPGRWMGPCRAQMPR